MLVASILLLSLGESALALPFVAIKSIEVEDDRNAVVAQDWIDLSRRYITGFNISDVKSLDLEAMAKADCAKGNTDNTIVCDHFKDGASDAGEILQKSLALDDEMMTLLKSATGNSNLYLVVLGGGGKTKPQP